MQTLIESYNEIVGPPRPPHATQEELDQLGHLLDRLELVEAYTDSSSCTYEENEECQVEIRTLCDRIDVLMEIV